MQIHNQSIKSSMGQSNTKFSQLPATCSSEKKSTTLVENNEVGGTTSSETKGHVTDYSSQQYECAKQLANLIVNAKWRQASRYMQIMKIHLNLKAHYIFQKGASVTFLKYLLVSTTQILAKTSNPQITDLDYLGMMYNIISQSDLEEIDNEGNTYLMLALIHKCPFEIIQNLLGTEHKVNDVRNKKNENLIDLAIRHDDDKVLDLMLNELEFLMQSKSPNCETQSNYYSLSSSVPSAPCPTHSTLSLPNAQAFPIIQAS